jgi:hypothetical protein
VVQSKGPGYETRINRILRRVMMDGKKREGGLIETASELTLLKPKTGLEWATRPDFPTLVFVVASYIGGAGVPSDHLPTGTTKMVSGSGTKRKGATTTGEPSRFAPQVAPSVFGM